jgi:hypothetical protein
MSEVHYHIAFGTFAVLSGEDVLVREYEMQTAIDMFKAHQFAGDYIHALKSAWNAVENTDLEVTVPIAFGSEGFDPGDTLVEYRIEFPNGRSEKSKVTVCDGEMVDEVPDFVVVVMDDGTAEIMDSLGIGQKFPGNNGNGVFH